MKIGLATPDDTWAAACRELDVPYLLLPCSTPSGDVGAADLQARHRAGKQVFDILQRDPVDLILDIDGAGLTFVEGAKGCGDLKLTHEMLQIPLVSYCAGSMPHALRGLPWPVVWHVLGSRMWTKILCAKDSVDELTRFGVPKCVCLPPATSRPMDAPSSNDCPPEVIFVGDAASWTRPQTALANTPADRISRIIAAFQIGNADRSFNDIYHDVFRVAEPPDANDPPEARLKKATEYFRVGQLYQADLTITLRDRFVVFLKGRLGERFKIVGKGWDGAYGIRASADPRAADTPSEPQGQRETGVPADPQSRGVDQPLLRIGAVNIVLPEAEGASSMIRNHLAIAGAGGFVLCYHHSTLPHSFEISQECDAFTQEAELFEKIEHYLKHPERRREMALAGQRRVLRDHLYSHRLQWILDNCLKPEPQASACANQVSPQSPRNDVTNDPHATSNHDGDVSSAGAPTHAI